MNRKLYILGLLMLLLAVVSACSPAQADEGAAPEAVEEPPVPVTVTQAVVGDIAQIADYTGDIQAKESVTVVPGAAGRVEQVLVEVGDVVKAGDPLATIESDLYRAQLKQAEAALASANLNLAKMEEGSRPEQIAAAQAGVELARASLEDVTSLSTDEQTVALAGIAQAEAGVNAMTDITDEQRTVAVANLAQAEAGLKLAQFEYDKVAWAGQAGMTPQALQLQQATIAYETALAAYNLQVEPNEHQLAAAEAGLQAAQAAYNLQANPSDAQLAPLLAQVVQAELTLALTEQPFTDTDFETVRQGIAQAEAAVEMATIQLDEASITAPVDGVVSEVYLTVGQTVGPGVPALQLVSEAIEVVINVEEANITSVFKDQNAALNVSAYPGVDFPAVVTTIAPVADSSTHTFAVTITPTDSDGQLRSGMFANVAVLAQEKLGVVLVPRAAIVTTARGNFAYVINGELAEERSVELGVFNTDQVEVLSGIEAGEVVVVAGQSNLRDGSKVNPGQ